MGAKDKIARFAEEVTKASLNKDPIIASINVRKIADKWMREAEQMFDDKENRVIFAGSVISAFLFGFMTGLFM